MVYSNLQSLEADVRSLERLLAHLRLLLDAVQDAVGHGGVGPRPRPRPLGLHALELQQQAVVSFL